MNAIGLLEMKNIFKAAVDAVKPGALIWNKLKFSNNRLFIEDSEIVIDNNCYVVGISVEMNHCHFSFLIILTIGVQVSVRPCSAWQSNWKVYWLTMFNQVSWVFHMAVWLRWSSVASLIASFQLLKAQRTTFLMKTPCVGQKKYLIWYPLYQNVVFCLYWYQVCKSLKINCY